MGRYGIGFSDAGRFTTLPNVFVNINADNLDLRPVVPGGIVAILAEGAGFFPPGVATSMPMGSGSPQRYISPSPLLTAVEYAVRPFAQLDRGVGEVLVVPVNPSTPATMALNKTGPVLCATLTTKGYGLTMNTVLITLTSTVLTVRLPTDNGVPIVETFTYSGVQDLVDQVNGRSGIVSATFAATGTLLTVATDTAMTGGTEPNAINSDWDAALHALDGIRVTSIAACSPSPTVHGYLAAYCILHRARGYIGGSIQLWNGTSNRATSIAALKAAAGALNAPRLMHLGLGMDGLDCFKSTAPRIAALAATVPPSVPMTFKHIDATSLEARLDPIAEVGGIDGLLLAGVAPPIPDPDAPATSVLSRGLSTWTGDDNLYRREHSVLAAADGVQDLIEAGCRQFLGNEGTEAVVRRAINLVDQILNDCTRPTAFVRINGYRRESISAFLDGQVLNISAAFTPIPPINFIPVSLMLERTEITRSFQVPLS